MHVLLVPIGSHGDVHPFVGLGVALRARGHRVTLVTNEHFAGMASRAGLDFIALGDEATFLRVTENPELWEPMKGFKLVMRMMGDAVAPVHEIIAREYVPGETVVAAQVTAWGARVAHDSLGVPLVSVHLQPSVMMSQIDPPKLPLSGVMRALPLWGRRLLMGASNRFLVDPLMAPGINRVRAQLGLAPVRNVMTWWHSPQSVLGLFPDWFAPPAPDWPPNVTLTGFPLFDESTAAPLAADVAAFLEAGAPPIVFTAGSAMRHGNDFFASAVQACEHLGRRGMLLARFDGQIPASLPSSVRHFAYVPFSQILPRAAALVHHGGVGTIGQGLAAGIPQLVVPMAHDQPDNAERLQRLGVGDALAPKRFNGRSAAAVLGRLLDDPQVRTRAKELAARIDRAATLARSCELIEAALQKPALAGVTQVPA